MVGTDCFSLLYKKSLGGQSMWGGMAVVIRGLDSVFLLLHEEHVHLLSPDFPTSCLQDDCCISRLASEFPAGKTKTKAGQGSARLLPLLSRTGKQSLLEALLRGLLLLFIGQSCVLWLLPLMALKEKRFRMDMVGAA